VKTLFAVDVLVSHHERRIIRVIKQMLINRLGVAREELSLIAPNPFYLNQKPN
jgi:hypothetical protein